MPSSERLQTVGAVTADELRALVQWAKVAGVRRFKLGGTEIEFAEDGSQDMVEVLENGIKQGREEVMRFLTEDQRAQVERAMKADFDYGSA